MNLVCVRCSIEKKTKGLYADVIYKGESLCYEHFKEYREQ